MGTKSTPMRNDQRHEIRHEDLAPAAYHAVRRTTAAPRLGAARAGFLDDFTDVASDPHSRRVLLRRQAPDALLQRSRLRLPYAESNNAITPSPSALNDASGTFDGVAELPGWR
jgi:hypothetical protein